MRRKKKEKRTILWWNFYSINKLAITEATNQTINTEPAAQTSSNTNNQRSQFIWWIPSWNTTTIYTIIQIPSNITILKKCWLLAWTRCMVKVTCCWLVLSMVGKYESKLLNILVGLREILVFCLYWNWWHFHLHTLLELQMIFFWCVESWN